MGPRRRATIVGAVAVLVAAAGSTAGCGDDRTPGEIRAGQVETAAREAGLDGDVVALLRRAALAVDATYHLAYDVQAPDGTTNRVEIDQRPPHRRVAVVGPDGAVEATIADGEASVRCRRPAGGAWSCEHLGRPAVAEALDPTAIDALTDALLASTGEFTYDIERRTVLDEPADCLVTTSVDATAELCLAADGAVLAVSTPAAALRAVEHATTVDDAVFEIPG